MMLSIDITSSFSSLFVFSSLSNTSPTTTYLLLTAVYACVVVWCVCVCGVSIFLRFFLNLNDVKAEFERVTTILHHRVTHHHTRISCC